ncbi:AAA family ATPase [uncultured Tenacibaculum sp.]|uniref:AAA family ATPase n=1 Tax=uncultured Tenacibaculum sp. TaxID=174713 RepID=UPI0026051438|nr:AAA family ATPase [uncultured Tenacibaculum sp.]
MSKKFEKNISDIANQLVGLEKNINLIYAFNGTGKTRLSVAYKDVTKTNNGGSHSGVYYNAYSEDLFNWDNDEENNGADIKLKLAKSSLNQFHPLLDEINLQDKLASYQPKFDYRFEYFDELNDGIRYIRFYNKKEDEEPLEEPEGVEQKKEEKKEEEERPIKISRGEEQIFVWCFFLALFEVDGWTGEDNQSTHFFIDDPVSSLDDHNIFVTISSLVDLIDKHFKKRKIIITTHHIGFFSVLADWLTRGEKASRYQQQVDIYKLKNNNGTIELVGPRKEVFLYHLELLRVIKEAKDKDEIYVYHFALLRQILENISSFLGVRNFSHVLKEIGFSDAEKQAQIVNIMAHNSVFRYKLIEPVPDNKKLIIEIFDAIQEKYKFVLHA